MDNKITKSENVLDCIIENKFSFVFFVLIFVLISTFLTLLQTNEYSSTSRVLIIQEQGEKLDAYIASKASESLSKSLKDAILSSSFRYSVLEKYQDTSLPAFASEQQRRKAWQKAVDVKIIPNTSILQIKTYNKSAFESEKLLSNIITILLENHKNYHGGGDTVKLQIIDSPVTSTYPVRPNWFINMFMSLILVLFFNISFVMLFPNKYSDLDAKLNNFFSSKHKNPKKYGKVSLVFNQDTTIDIQNNIPQQSQSNSSANNQANSEMGKQIANEINIDYDEIRKRILERK